MRADEYEKPICGALSVCLPAAGVLFGFASVAAQLDSTATLLLSLAGPVGGVACGALGVARGERLRWLPFLGAVLSICVGACFFLL